MRLRHLDYWQRQFERQRESILRRQYQHNDEKQRYFEMLAERGLAVAARDYGMKPCSLASLLLRIIVRDGWIDRLLEPPPRELPPLPQRPSHRVEPRVAIPPSVLAARGQRYQLEAQRDMTAVLMGDPPPRSLGACAVGERIFTCNVLGEVYMAAHLPPRPSFVVQVH